MQWCGWKVIITPMTETKAYYLLDDVNERVSLLFLKRTFWQVNTQVLYLLHFIPYVSPRKSERNAINLWCCEKKIFGFICSTKIFQSIIFSSNFPSYHSIPFCHPLYISHTYLKVILLQRVKIKIQIPKKVFNFQC